MIAATADCVTVIAGFRMGRCDRPLSGVPRYMPMSQHPEDAPATRSASRVVYTVALIGALLASAFPGGGWVSLVRGTHGAGLTTGMLLIAAVIGRLIWVWRRDAALALPESRVLDVTAVWALRLSLVGTVGYLGTLGSGFFVQGLAQDTRGAVGLVIGLMMLPVVMLAPLGLGVFEAARCWSLRSSVPATARPLLPTAVIFAALATVAPWLSATLLRSSDFRPIAELAVLGPWPLLALGAGLLIVQAGRAAFPAGAVFGSAMVAALAAGVGVTAVAMLVQAWQLRGIEGASSINLFVIAAGLGGFCTNAVLIALPLAIVPALASRAMRGEHGTPGSPPSSKPLIAATVGAFTLFVVGLVLNAPRLAAERSRFQATAVSPEQREAQDRLLRSRCATAGTRVIRTVPDVTAVEVVFPGTFPPDYKRFPQIPTTPEPGRPHDWFPPATRGVAGFDSVVFNFNGERRAYSRDGRDGSGGYRDVDAATIAAPYVMRWRRLDTLEEVAAGVAGVQYTLHDSGDGAEIARQTLFFKRVAGDFGYREACGTFAGNRSLDGYAFNWVRAVLIPRQGPADPPSG